MAININILFDIKWKVWKKYISINIKLLLTSPKSFILIHNVSIILSDYQINVQV